MHQEERARRFVEAVKFGLVLLSPWRAEQSQAKSSGIYLEQSLELVSKAYGVAARLPQETDPELEALRFLEFFMKPSPSLKAKDATTDDELAQWFVDS